MDIYPLVTSDANDIDRNILYELIIIIIIIVYPRNIDVSIFGDRGTLEFSEALSPQPLLTVSTLALLGPKTSHT